MKPSLYFITTFLCFISFSVNAQNSPLFIWGTGLDGSSLQKTGIYSDTNYGLMLEAPILPGNIKAPIEFNWRGGGTPALKVLANGNIGIGTANPTAKVDVIGSVASYNVGLGQSDQYTSSKNYVNFTSNVHGSVLVSSNLYISSNDNLKIANSHSTVAGAAILMPGNGMPNQGSIVFYSNNPSSVVAESGFTGSSSMIINGSGNIGIGTLSPGNYKLAVNGVIRAKEIKVETGWADFVFADGYKLTPLHEVEKFITTNKHLPDLPSESEVRENGIGLGEINTKLLQKIEELTLYLIDLKKENDALRMDLEDVKIKLNTLK